MTFQYKLRRLAECIGQLLAVHLVLHLDSKTRMLRAEQHRVAVTVLCPLIGGLVFFHIYLINPRVYPSESFSLNSLFLMASSIINDVIITFLSSKSTPTSSK